MPALKAAPSRYPIGILSFADTKYPQIPSQQGTRYLPARPSNFHGIFSEVDDPSKYPRIQPGDQLWTCPTSACRSCSACYPGNGFRISDADRQAGYEGISKWIIDLRKKYRGNCWPMLGIGPCWEWICGYFYPRMKDPDRVPRWRRLPGPACAAAG